MGPTGSIAAERSLRRERQLQDLLALYGQERRIYGEVLELSRRQGEMIRRREDLGAIREVLEAKRSRLELIGQLEARHAEARRYWERQRSLLTGPLVVQLQRALQDVGTIIEEILQLEADNDRLFLEQTAGETP